MWVWSTFAYLAPAVFVTIQMLSPKDVKQPYPRLSISYRKPAAVRGA
jgi:hypothetical protein